MISTVLFHGLMSTLASGLLVSLVTDGAGYHHIFSGRKKYGKVPPQGVNANTWVFITWYALTHLVTQTWQSMLDVAKALMTLNALKE